MKIENEKINIEPSDEYIPNILSKYESLVMNSVDFPKVKSLFQYGMYLLPEVRLSVNGEQIDIKSDLGPVSGYMELINDRYCTEYSREYKLLSCK
jgi:hypothetical protein